MKAPARHLVLDAGALIDVERHPRGRVAQTCMEAVNNGRIPLIPVLVWAQVWRDGPRQATLGMLRRQCEVLDFTEADAYRAGGLLGSSRTSDVVDASVALVALEYDALVLTSDVGDIEALGKALGAELMIQPV